MATKQIVCVLLVAAMAVMAHAELVCNGENEELSQVTRVCPPTCANHGVPECLGLYKHESCKCKSGFLLESKHSTKCVTLDNCPKTLKVEDPISELVCNGENEELSQVTRVCPPTCANHGVPECLGLYKHESCKCKSGFLLESKHSTKCVTLDNCPKTLEVENPISELVCNGENEELSQVTRVCPPTCANHGVPECIGLYKHESCKCKSGFLRDTKHSTKCVTLDNCPKTLKVEDPILICDGEHETLREITPMCPATCANRGKPRCLGIIRKPSCQCESGFVRDTPTTNRCLRLEECSKTQIKRSLTNLFGANGINRKSLEQLELEQYSDAEKEKIRKSCNPDTEQYSELIPACPRSCMHGFKSGMLCHALVAKPACVCRTGYLLDSESGQCIHEKSCHMSY